MPFVFDFDSTNGILRCRLHGRITDETLEDFFRAGYEHALRTRPRAGVVDLSEVISFEVSAQTIERLAKGTPVLSDPHHGRIIIAPSPTIYGMMRMFEIAGEEKRPNLNVVRSEREAWAILAVQKPRFEPLDTK